MNQILKKFCAVTTTVCFMLLVVNPSIFASVPTNSQKSLDGITMPETEKIPLNKNIQDSLISSKYGKVISVNDKNSDTVVINIQDLHCDYSVQKNIYNIIDELCGKYNVENIYSEGGIGTSDFGVFDSLKPAYKKSVLENLLKSGRLTGTEYYTILNDKQGFLKGVEDEKSYNENIARLSEILKSKQDTEKYLARMDTEIGLLKAKYLTSKNKSFNKLLDKYENKKISQKEFLSKLFAIAIDNNINTKKYKNLQNYFSLTLSSSDINKKALSKEFTTVINEIKNNVSYEEYKKMLSLTSNFTDFPSAKMVIENYCNNKKINIAKVYPNLNKFLSLKKDSLNINPVAMVKEERKLIDTVRTYLSNTATELEIAYISDFKDFYKRYITAELTSAQWEYVKIGLEKFEELYAKYSVQNDVSKLQKYSQLLTDFYNVNTERNTIFLKNMHLLSSSNHPSSSAFNSSPVHPFTPSPSIFSAKKILILVSGGYHTEGITELLNKNNISNITITPEVVNVSASTRAVYENLVANQAMSFRQMIALGLITNANHREQVAAILVSMFTGENNNVLENINVNMLATHLNQIFSQKVSFTVLGDGKTIEVTFADGTKQTIDLPVAAANAASEMQDYGELTAGKGEFRRVTATGLMGWAKLANKASLSFGRDIFAPQVYQISKDIFVWVVKNGFYQGDGASYRIAISNYDGKFLDGVDPVVYEYMPEFMQDGLLVAQQEQDGVSKPESLTKKNIKSVFQKGLMLILTFVLVLNMTACSLFNKGTSTSGYPIETIISQVDKSNVSASDYADFNNRMSKYLGSFYAGNGKYNSFSYEYMDPDKVFVNNTASSIQNLYDQALAALSYIQIGDLESAERILSTINSNGTFYKSNLERYKVTGEIVWVGIAATQYKLLTGKTKFDSLIQTVDDYLSSVHKKDGSYYGQSGHIWISTEHMIDIVCYYNLKSRYDDSEETKQYLEAAASFVYNNLYNEEKGGFFRGYKDEEYVLDTQTWGFQMLLALAADNPEIYESSGLNNIDLDRLLNFIEEFKATDVPEKYQNLYVWSLAAGSTWSGEWSGEVAVCYELYGQHEKAQAIIDDSIAYSKELGAYNDYIVYTDRDGEIYPGGWEGHVVNALCTTVGQQVQFKYGVSFLWFLKKIDGLNYDAEFNNISNVSFIMEEDYNWRTYATDKLVDLTDVTDITLRIKLKEVPQDFEPKIRIRFLPEDPHVIQDLTNIADFGVIRHDYTFDENGELVLNLNLDNDVWMELCGTTNKARLKEVLMNPQYMRIIVIAGQYSFNYRLNEGKLNADISIEFYNNGEPVTFFDNGTTSDKSILRTTFAEINNLIAEGSATTFNILKTIIKAETWFSFFRPGEFIKAHPVDNKGAVILSSVTVFAKFMALLVAFTLTISGAALVTVLASFVVSMVAALFVNITTHVIMDYRFIKSSGLDKAIVLYGRERVSFNEDGTLYISPEKRPRVVSSVATPWPGNYTDIKYSRTMYVITDVPENSEDFHFVPIKEKVKKQTGDDYSRMWIGNYKGTLVLYSPGVNAEDLINEFTGSWYFRKNFGVKFKNDFIQIDMVNPNREVSYSDAGHIVVGANLLQTGEYIDYRKEAALVANKKVDAVTINQNVAVFIDDISSPENMADTAKSFVSGDSFGATAKILFTDFYIDKVISSLELKFNDKDLAKTEFIKIIKDLKDNYNIEISVVFETDSFNLQKYFSYGMFSYIAGDTYFDSVSDTQTKVKMISNLRNIEGFDGSLSVLKISQFKDEIENTSGIFTFLNSAIQIKTIMISRSINFVKQAASNFDFSQIPEMTMEEITSIINASQSVIADSDPQSMVNKTPLSSDLPTFRPSDPRSFAVKDNIFPLIEPYLDPVSQISVYYKSLRVNERAAFSEELLKRILAVNYMRQHGIKHGLRDHNMEVLLSRALYKSVTPSQSDLYTESFRFSGLQNAVKEFTQSVPNMSAAEVEYAFNELLTRLTPLAFEQNDPDAISAIIDLIPVYADKNIAQLDMESVDFINKDTLTGLRAVLAAA